MLRFVRIAAALCLAAWAGTGIVRSFPGADTADEVRSVDADVYQAIGSRDADRLKDLLADDFVLISTFGEVFDKDSFVTACCTGPAAASDLLVGATDIQVNTYGDAAVVLARTEMRFTRDDQEEKLVWRSTRVYVRDGRRWKLAAEQRTSIG